MLHGPDTLATAERRILDRIRRDESGCWLLDTGLTGQGYARLMVDWLMDLGHRWSFMIWHGDIPEGLVVRHTCDVPNCVNPEHLLLGTQSDNIQDAIQRGRYVKNRGGATLDWDTVEAIRSEAGSAIRLAEKYGVTRNTIWRIKTGRTWVRSSTET